jgi:hypothetical protein
MEEKKDVVFILLKDSSEKGKTSLNFQELINVEDSENLVFHVCLVARPRTFLNFLFGREFKLIFHHNNSKRGDYCSLIFVHIFFFQVIEVDSV